MASVTFSHISRQFPGVERPAVDDLNLQVDDGEFLVLVGPSGCGKTTTLRILAGLEAASSGDVLIGDRVVTDVQPSDRDVAMVFQSYALYPHLSVAKNMAFALQMARVPRKERNERVRVAAQMLDLEPLLDRRPGQLSGGQRQRVAMGRAIVRRPAVFCMDEPLSNLDAKLRVQTRLQISQLQRRLGVTTLYVTHDQVEAMTMGDRIAVMKDGVLQQCDQPSVLYDEPSNAFVAGFIGSPAMNLFAVEVADDGAVVGGHRIALSRDIVGAAQGSALIGVRPEHWILSESDDGVPVTVVVVEHLGSELNIYGHLPAGGQDVVIRADPEAIRPVVGSTVRVLPNPKRVHVFSADGALRLS